MWGRVQDSLLKCCLVFPFLDQGAMERNPEDGTGPVHVPLGHIIANQKWRGSLLAQDMQGRWAALCINSLSPTSIFKKSLPIAAFSCKAHGTFLVCILREN